MDIATERVAALEYYARHGAALFPIPAGQKAPYGIVPSFLRDYSRDPQQWGRWYAEHACNFGVVAFASNWIIADIDTAGGRDEAWAAWCALCAEWGLAEPAMPHVQSARGGWHAYFQVPEGVDASTLRQPDALKGVINIRCRGYTVAAGSHFEGLPYQLLSDAPPHPAPAALIAHCTRGNARAASTHVGQYGLDDVAGLIAWLNERDAFNDYASWIALGAALKLEFGDDGLALWESATWPEALGDVEYKWQSFASDPTPGCVTLNTFLARAHAAGWTGKLRPSAEAQFADAVAKLAANAGAGLVGGRGAEQVRQWSQILEAVPRLARGDDHPLVPKVVEHPLVEALNGAIPGMFADPAAHADALAVLQAVHPDTAAKLLADGRADEAHVKARAAYFSSNVERALRFNADYTRDNRGNPEPNNPDNLRFFMRGLEVELRFNAWLERIEVRGWHWPRWTYFDDTVVARLRERAGQTATRFNPTVEFLWSTALAIAHDNVVDPVLETFDQLAGQWDGVPRLRTWLSVVTGCPCDPYHQAVGRLLVGSIVRRGREPGCKQDETVLLISKQGTGKSTLARMLAPRPEWFSDAIKPGDESKELVLSLAGKLVVEFGELDGMARKDVATVKAMLSRQSDRGRPAYGRAVIERPRRNIFIGTSNDEAPLKDSTGNRRWLPVHLPGALNLEWLREHRDQLLGEAAWRHAKGETFRLPSSVWAAAADRQEAARAQEAHEILLEGEFGRPDEPGQWLGETEIITANDLLTLVHERAGKIPSQVYTQAMTKLGFKRDQKKLDGKTVKIWLRGRRTPTRRWRVRKNADGFTSAALAMLDKDD